MSVKRKGGELQPDLQGPSKRRRAEEGGAGGEKKEVIMAENGQKDDREFEAEYSRLIHAVGKDALLKMQQYRILLGGLGGLGAEIAKNLVLTGVKSLTLFDPRPAVRRDQSSNFLVGDDDLGKSRAEAALPKLREMNERVDLSVHEGDTLTDDLVGRFNIVVLTDNTSLEEAQRLNDACRAHGTGFVLADTRGLFGAAFVDLGPEFVTQDSTGERVVDRLVEFISNEKEPTVTVISSGAGKHDLQDGDVITFDGVEGMEEINGRSAKVAVLTSHSVKLLDLDTSSFGKYLDRGRIIQVKQPKKFAFKTLRETLHNYDPDHTQTMDFMKDLTTKPTLHVYYQALLTYQQEHNGALPRPHNDADADALVAVAQRVNKSLAQPVEDLDEKLLRSLAKVAAGDLSPMACTLGGILAQEVMKHAALKFTPLHQWLYFDALECLGGRDVPEAEAQARGDRYDGQVAVFGRTFTDRVRSLRYFLVGSGAIGCEMLKNWAMMGVGTLADGKVFVTDMDTIEVSNLNRQFLYRSWDVGHFKSETAAKAVTKMNPDLRTTAYTIKAAPETEDTFNSKFWMSLDGVQNALDNVNARMYIDNKCVFFRKSLIEPGTMGAKGNVQVVVPGLTESYSSSPDPPTPETPICLLHAFPNNIEHCLQWARELLFEGYFTKDADITNQFVDKPDYLSSVSSNLLKSTLETLEQTLVARPETFDDCIQWARHTFDKHYYEAIEQLLYTFPVDYTDDKGHKFWSSAKRPPTSTRFDPTQESHVNFVTSATFLRAHALGIIDSELKPADLDARREHIVKVAAETKPRPFSPRAGVKIETDPDAKNSQAETADDDDEVISTLEEKILNHSAKVAKEKMRMNPIDFEKDDDSNFHIDFIQAAANIRATAYKIKPVDRLQCKLIAGKIIPAMITTTAVVSGLSCLELYKIHQEPKLKLEAFSDTFVNLGISLYAQSDPREPPTLVYKEGKEFNLWDRIEVNEGSDITLQGLIDNLEEKEGIEVDMIGVGNTLLYFNWMAPAKCKERLQKKLRELIPEVSKKPLTTDVVAATVTGSFDGEELESIPDVFIYL
mmetsp:Transcript_8059/g.22820  ORF Transcript_8059/g.22820 Transcript_8059/m.22820 type:complete len:1067 (-) Transcript_8059:85-3285(-)